MKKLLSLLTAVLFCISYTNAQKVCCPSFELRDELMPCDTGRANPVGGTGGTGSTGSTGGGTGNENPKPCDYYACKHSQHTYYVYPVMAGFTYTWSVTGGTPASPAGSQMNITWGNGNSGSITVYVSNADGSCRDTLRREMCLLDAPVASFTSSPNPVCKNGVVQFSNTTTGALAYYWDFGDGTTSTLTNPSHIYAAPGTYTVTLTASAGLPPVQGKDCTCKHTVIHTVVVKNESGVNIIPGCKQMLCAGDTSDYCTTNTCSGYNWSVTGGTIIGAANGKCIKVRWNGSYPATVTLSGNCGGACGNTATINVPVLYPTMQVTGNIIVCQGAAATYSLPVMPGTFYNWSMTPASGGYFIGATANTAAVNIKWTAPSGTYTVKCNYYNPATKCSGTASTSVQILPPYKIGTQTKFCVGDNFSFSANGSGNWQINPATGFTPASSFSGVSSISGKWNVPGSYTITANPVTPSSYCSYPATLTVIVNDTPKLGPILGPLVICPGATSVYSITSNLPGYFSWIPVNGTLAGMMGTYNDSVSIQWNSTGPHSISVTQTADGCTSSPKAISISIYQPPALSGISTVCMDNIVNYTATGTAPPGGFTWSINNGLGTLMSPQGNNTMSVLWHGSANPNCILSVTTCAGTASLPITIITPPALTITATGPLCTPTGKNLTGSLSGTYQWYLNNVLLTSPYNTQSINVPWPGVYKAVVTLPGGCTSTAFVTVVAEQVPNASASTTGKIIYDCNETISTVLTALPTGIGLGSGYCYQWFVSAIPNSPGSAIAGATAQNYTATGVGYFWCEVSFCGTQCKAASDTINIRKRVCQPGCTQSNHKINVTYTGCNPITFTGAIVPTAPGGTITWTWENGSSTSSNPATRQYKFIGTYPVCVSWSVPGYCTKDSCFTVTVPLAANFKAAANCKIVTFTNLSSSVTPGYTSLWSFPGGTPSTSNLQNPPPVTYTTGGLHSATLTVSNSTCTVSYTDTFTVHNPAVTMGVPTPICSLTNAPFTATGGDPSWQYQWNFGDTYFSNLQNPTHAYATVLVPTPKTVTLVVTDGFGCTYTDTKTITVLPPLSANIGADRGICAGGTTVITVTPNSFGSYQWYHNGVAISGATGSSYTASLAAAYYVQVSNGTGCVAASNTINVTYKTTPSVKIRKTKVQCSKTFALQNIMQQPGCTYTWSSLTPGVSFTPNATNGAWYTNVTVPATGNVQIVLSVTNSPENCTAKDTICVTVAQTVTASVVSPAGSLCEGATHTFTASALPAGNYTYLWSNGVTGNTMSTGQSGVFSVTVTNDAGCSDTKYTSPVSKTPDVSLFPKGCDTLCLTDTLFFPLPNNNPPYTIQWFDSGVPVGTNATYLVLAAVGAGDHHFYTTVSFPGGCASTSSTFDLFVKDCTLLPACDNCAEILGNATFTPSGSVSGNILKGVITFNNLKPLKELRISISDLIYHWSDTACANCKTVLSERNCLFPVNATQQIGTLVWDNFSGVSLPPAAPATDCPKELVFKEGIMLTPGSYSIPVQISFPAASKTNCKLLLDKLCMHLFVKDADCKVCEKNICSTDGAATPADTACKCNPGNNWTNLYLVPLRPGVPKPKTLIFCSSTITGYNAGIAYTLSGIYNCPPGCVSTKTEVVIHNQTGDIIYTHSGAVLYENVVFPVRGNYTVTLTAWCGNKKCECIFKITVDPKIPDPNDPDGPQTPGNPNGSGNPQPPVTSLPPVTTGTTGISVKTSEIDKIVTEMLPPDFSGAVLVAQKDSILYEKYKGKNVNNHTAFDLASVTKTFTAMAILKMAEEQKIKLDDDAGKYLPGFPYNGITIKMLLSHRSGLEDYVKFLQAPDVDRSIMMSNQDLLQYIIANKNKVKIAAPGTVFDYSNTNYALLALVIEKISGKTYAEYLSDKFFKPLHMDDTYLYGPKNFANATASYYSNGKPYQRKSLDDIYGDKNVYTTVKDMVKWDKALRDGKIFSTQTMALAYTPGSQLIPYQSNYGLGWRILSVPNGKRIVYHNGWWHGMKSVFIRLQDEEAVIIVLSNSSFSAISNSRKIADLFGQYQQANKAVINF